MTPSYQDRLTEILRKLIANTSSQESDLEPIRPDEVSHFTNLHQLLIQAQAAINALNGETLDSIDIGQLYNPGIEDLELDEHRNEDQPVVYLKQVGKKVGDLRRRFGVEE